MENRKIDKNNIPERALLAEQNVKAENESLIPSLYFKLAFINENESSHRYYQIRHPGAVFSIHFEDVLTALKELGIFVTKLQENCDKCTNEDHKKLESLSLILLFQLINYFESGYEMFLCFCGKKTKPKKDKPLFQWFEVNGYKEIISSYFNNINPFLKDYRNLFNALKHSSNHLGIFNMFNPTLNKKILGFYLQGVDEAGAIGPVRDFHPMFEGLTTAWSFNYHAIKIYYLIYKIALEMEAVMEKLSKKENLSFVISGLETKHDHIGEVAKNAFLELQKFYKVFNVFYPQEYKDDIWVGSEDLSKGPISFTKKIFAPVSFLGWGIQATYRGDGFSKSFNLIYYRGK